MRFSYVVFGSFVLGWIGPVWALPQMDQARQRALNAPMVFHPARSCTESGCVDILLAQGTIEVDTPQALARAIASYPKRSTIYLDSPGGNVVGAIRMGSALRALGYTTVVGGGDNGMVCFSACPYVLMGGRARRVEEGSVLGWHQFSVDGSQTIGMRAEDMAAASQELVSHATAYAMTMGIDPIVVRFSTSIAHDDMKFTSAEAARLVNLDNTQPGLGTWRVQPTTDGNSVLMVEQQQPNTDVKATMGIGRTERAAVVVVRVWPGHLGPVVARAGVRPTVHLCRGNTCVAGVARVVTQNEDDESLAIVFTIDTIAFGRLTSVAGAQINLHLTNSDADSDRSVLVFPGAGFDQMWSILSATPHAR